MELQPHVITFTDATAPNGGVTLGGTSGGGSDAHYEAQVVVPNTTWIVMHNLGKFPSVTITDSSKIEIEAEITHDSNLQLTVRFSQAQDGYVFLN